MKTCLMVLTLSCGLGAVSAHADVGQSGTPVNCTQVVGQIQEQIKRQTAAAEPSAPATPAAGEHAAPAQ